MAGLLPCGACVLHRAMDKHWNPSAWGDEFEPCLEGRFVARRVDGMFKCTITFAPLRRSPLNYGEGGISTKSKDEDKTSISGRPTCKSSSA